MLQLKHIDYIKRLTGAKPHELKAVKFGYNIHYTAAAQYVLASQQVPRNVSLLVLRTQVYLTNQEETATDYGFYRTIPNGLAYWIVAPDTSNTTIQAWSNPNAPSQLALDCDEFLLFPSGLFANLLFTAADPAPTGDFFLRTTIFAYFVPPKVSDALGGPQSWINVQQ